MDKEKLQAIKKRLSNFNFDLLPIWYKDMDRLISTVEEQHDELQHRGKLIEHLGNTAGKLNEYLQGKVTDGWGDNVADVAIRLTDEQQKEIEQLNKAVEKEMHTGYSLEGQYHDVKEKLEKENYQLRKAMQSASSELNYALHSNKSNDVKRFYTENAKRYLDEALEVTE